MALGKLPLLGAVSAIMAVQAVVAGHVPGHDDCDLVFPVPLPDEQTYNGGIIFVTSIGPFPEVQILETVVSIRYVSDGATPARDLLLNIQVPVDGELRELELTGAQLGFGTGPGTFTGTLVTPFFDGEVWNNSPFPHSLVEIGIGAVGGGVDGYSYFVQSTITFKLGLRVDGGAPTQLHYPSPFDAVTGLLSDLQSRGQYFDATCLGTFETSSGTDPLPEPPLGAARYYLARNLGSCLASGYGDSSLNPDPRDWLDENSPCP